METLTFAGKDDNDAAVGMASKIPPYDTAAVCRQSVEESETRPGKYMYMKSARNASREILAIHVPASPHLWHSASGRTNGLQSDATWTPKYMRVHFTNWAHSFRKSWPWTRASHYHHRGGSAGPAAVMYFRSLYEWPARVHLLLLTDDPFSHVRVCVQDLLIPYIVQLGHEQPVDSGEAPNSLCTAAAGQSALNRFGSMYSRTVPIIICIYL